MTWAVYARPRRVPSMELLALRSRYRGWLEASKTLTPQQANALRLEMGLRPHDPRNPSELMRQVMMLERATFRHTGEGPPPHPADTGQWVFP